MAGRTPRHEWRLLFADATVWVIAGVFSVGIAYGILNGVGWVGFRRAALRAAAAEEASRYDQITAQVRDLESAGTPVAPFGDPRNPTMFGSRFGPRYAMLPPGPLAPLAIGQSDLLPYYFKVSTDARETAVAATEIENRTGYWSVASISHSSAVYFYPLLILAVTYNMLSIETEQARLRSRRRSRFPCPRLR